MAEIRTRVAVVFGGRSGEHEVSCSSATSIVRHLDRRRYEVVPVRITLDGVWVVGAAAPAEVDIARLVAATAEPAGTDALTSLAEAIEALRDVDLVFPALHGPYGEDGTIQALLELANLAYVGNGVFASAAGMDKEYTKKLLVAEGLPVAAGVVLRGERSEVSLADRERLGLPVFVKPARAGSSLGVSRVDNWDELAAAVEVAHDSDSKVLVEEAVRGREIDIGVLEHPDGRVEAGPPLEIRLTEGQAFFSYDAKYIDPDTVFDIPAKLDPEIGAVLRDYAVRAFHALGCSGLLRVDFFLRDGVHAVVNEVNTFPGFTAVSQFPQMFAAAGLAYPELLDVLIDTAQVRWRGTGVTRPG